MAVSVREYGYLAIEGEAQGLDRQKVSKLDFEFLRAIAIQQEPLMDAFRLTSRWGQEAIQARNYVGVVALPSGEQLEIVPKTTLGWESVEYGRGLLLKMLSVVAGLDFRQSGFASLETLNRPWLEILIAHMLRSISRLVRGGLRKAYVRARDEKPYLRGQLRVAAQLRQRPGRQDKFHLSYDEYSLDRAENRLLRSAIERLGRWSRQAENQRLCRELLFAVDEVPASTDFSSDIKNWARTRDMILYAPLRPWIQLILTNQSPIFSQGTWEGISLLFPMEQLFEEYVAERLKKSIARPYRVKAQARSESLVRHEDRPLFQLRPDLLIVDGNLPVSVLDTKWKLLDASLGDGKNKYGLSQADFYQLFAYGEKYLAGNGDMFLVYPLHQAFTGALPRFDYTEKLRLWVVPFDLDSDSMVRPSPAAFEFLRQNRDQAAA